MIGALRAREHSFFRIGASNSNNRAALPDTVKRRDELQSNRWPKGFRLFRYWWTGGAAVYVAEMDRTASNLQFHVELANDQILGRETITGATRRLMERDVLPLAGVNGSFGIREDNRGRGGMMFNLHIQNGELVSISTPLDRWGYSPPSAWGETSFGVTPRWWFLLDRVKLNGELKIAGATLPIDAVNQICDSICPAVIYTPRFGRRTLTRRCYEFTLRQIELPLTGKYTSRFVVTAVNPRGNSVIPFDGVVLAIEPGLVRDWRDKITKSTAGTLEIALTPKNGSMFSRGSVGIYGLSEMVRSNLNSSSLVSRAVGVHTDIVTVHPGTRAAPSDSTMKNCSSSLSTVGSRGTVWE